MKVTFDDAKNTYKEYAAADTSMSDYYISFPDEVNTLDPLFMLERINEKPSFARKVEMIVALISGKKVEIWYQDPPVKDEDGSIKEVFEPVKVKGFVFNGDGSLGALFTEDPYLMQVLVDYGYALIIKKLTPPSRSSK